VSGTGVLSDPMDCAECGVKLAVGRAIITLWESGSWWTNTCWLLRQRRVCCVSLFKGVTFRNKENLANLTDGVILTSGAKAISEASAKQ